ncbi:unnamed protein product, partial [Didymodactylos carnosus]
GRQLPIERQNGSQIVIVTIIICSVVAFTMAVIGILFFIKRDARIRNKLAELTHIKGFSTKDYQDLCRQRMQTQPQTKSPISPSSHSVQTNILNTNIKNHSEGSSNRSSTSSWSEDPILTTNMDIMTGHLILNYMEDHLRNRNRLEAEWQELCNYESDRGAFTIALSEVNTNKNRYIDVLPYDDSRILLTNNFDKENNDYINANPKCKYIATQGPLPQTTNAFWQMVWENGSSVIVALTRPIEDGVTMCHHYWPAAGNERLTSFEVNLVSEHIWCDDYLVRSFYLKNIQTMETRTVTQFHFLTWSELGTPPSAKSLLDFRRKVNKCYRGKSSPIIVHCNDGVGRTGTYILLDMVLNRVIKGAREIDIAAALEHIRDQRAKMVKTKNQFQFVFVAVAAEHNLTWSELARNMALVCRRKLGALSRVFRLAHSKVRRTAVARG